MRAPRRARGVARAGAAPSTSDPPGRRARSTACRTGSRPISRSTPRPGSTRRGAMRLLADWLAWSAGSSGPPGTSTSPTAKGPRRDVRPRVARSRDVAEARGADVDKVWVIRVGRDGAGLRARRAASSTRRPAGSARRTAARRPVVRRPASRACSTSRSDLFRPTARSASSRGAGVALTVRGASLRAASPLGQVVAAGTVFRPLRVVTLPGGERRGPRHPVHLPPGRVARRARRRSARSSAACATP